MASMTAQMMFTSGEDVVTFLKNQHQEMKDMFSAVTRQRATPEARTAAFLELRRMLAVHEAAEEEIVHPIARIKLTNGDGIIDARLYEENAAKQALAELETMDVMSSEFLSKFESFQAKVLAHAEAEEREEFELLGHVLDPLWLVRMRRAAEFAEAIAPTRPHAGMESAVANILVGPFVSMIDRARDAFAQKS